MVAKKKILIVTPRYPFPVIGGDKLRIAFICKELSKFFDLDLISLTDQKENDLSEAEAIFGKIKLVYHPILNSILGMICSLLFGYPLQVGYFFSYKMKKFLSNSGSDYDAVIFHLIRTAEYAKVLPKKSVKILEMTDAISLNYKRLQAIKVNGIKAKIFRFEAFKVEKYEKNCLNIFDIISFISDIDKAHVAQSNPKTVVIPNGVDCNKFKFSVRRGEDIIFIGNIESVQNFDACKYFAERILPRIRSKYPNIHFKIVGKSSPYHEKRLSELVGVTLTGQITSVPDAVTGGFCGVCPMRFGAGVQNKILEYMSMGLPVVTSTIGLEGILADPNKDLIVSDDEGDFANEIIHIYENGSSYDCMAKNARNLVEKFYSWEGCSKELIEKLNSAISNHAK